MKNAVATTQKPITPFHASGPVLKNGMKTPSSSEIRDAYFRSVDRHAEILARAIDEDRAAGVAVDSVPSQQLAAGLIWTIERVWFGAVSGFDDLGERDAVAEALAGTVSAAIYGR